jgi:D-alanyl-D-alanine carboxypeptidase/D-alanyl-D-alanine-endopeptidase (penicillin-binding protein 4)
MKRPPIPRLAIASIVCAQFLASPLGLLASAADRNLKRAVDGYLNRLTSEKLKPADQGVLIETSDRMLAWHQGATPLPAASMTKVATSLAALVKLGPQYRFATDFGIAGTLDRGVLNGDLVVKGSGDPFFVWEDAIAVANQLQRFGIRRVEGLLVVAGDFDMNFRADPTAAAALLRAGFDSRIWPKEAAGQFDKMPAGTVRPALEIRGDQARAAAPADVKWIARHYSQPLVALLKRMNLYSNNMMAELVASDVGGPDEIARIAIDQTGIAANEIHVVNGSGLGIENRISPRAICVLLRVLDRLLQSHGLTMGDVFAVVGRDQGILEKRNLPPMLIAKSGTLATVSDLCGALPTRNGILWFSIMNQGPNVPRLRIGQARLLVDLENIEGSVAALPPQLAPQLAADRADSRIEGLLP